MELPPHGGNFFHYRKDCKIYHFSHIPFSTTPLSMWLYSNRSLVQITKRLQNCNCLSVYLTQNKVIRLNRYWRCHSICSKCPQFSRTRALSFSPHSSVHGKDTFTGCDTNRKQQFNF